MIWLAAALHETLNLWSELIVLLALIIRVINQSSLLGIITFVHWIVGNLIFEKFLNRSYLSMKTFLPFQFGFFPYAVDWITDEYFIYCLWQNISYNTSLNIRINWCFPIMQKKVFFVLVLNHWILRVSSKRNVSQFNNFTLRNMKFL